MPYATEGGGTSIPSETDAETMQSIVADASVGVNFLILMIVKLDWRRRLHVSATAYRVGIPAVAVTLECQPEESRTLLATARHWVRRLLRA
jgi:hypothetical protein